MKKDVDILKFIQENKEKFQVNFQFIKPQKKKIEGRGRMINIEKYQTSRLLIDSFYKKISRVML